MEAKGQLLMRKTKVLQLPFNCLSSPLASTTFEYSEGNSILSSRWPGRSVNEFICNCFENDVAMASRAIFFFCLSIEKTFLEIIETWKKSFH